MSKITIKDVLFEFTYQWDKWTTIKTIILPDEDGIGEKCQSVIKAYDELYPLYGKEIEKRINKIERKNPDGIDDDEIRIEVIKSVLSDNGNKHSLETIIY